MDFDTLAQQCAPSVHISALRALVKTESDFNPYAIGVVGAPLARQPRTLDEALAVQAQLERRGYDYSVGYAQINRRNFARHGLTPRSAFDGCSNLRAGAAILGHCYSSAGGKYSDPQRRLRAAYSCYYSGNFVRGFQPDQPGKSSYVERVLAHALGSPAPTRAPAGTAANGLGQGWRN